jgi:hypothetical protein
LVGVEGRVRKYTKGAPLGKRSASKLVGGAAVKLLVKRDLGLVKE